MFENLAWEKDRLLMDGLVFRLQHFVSDDWELGDECFLFFKTRELVAQYESFFAATKTFRPQTSLSWVFGMVGVPPFGLSASSRETRLELTSNTDEIASIFGVTLAPAG